jgi:hypothetical protein
MHVDWTKCESIPPAPGKRVLILYKKQVAMEGVKLKAKVDNKTYYYSYGMPDILFEENEITHWMPLPDPPKD